jgi:hypothetical protein
MEAHEVSTLVTRERFGGVHSSCFTQPANRAAVAALVANDVPAVHDRDSVYEIISIKGVNAVGSTAMLGESPTAPPTAQHHNNDANGAQDHS